MGGDERDRTVIYESEYAEEARRGHRDARYCRIAGCAEYARDTGDSGDEWDAREAARFTVAQSKWVVRGCAHTRMGPPPPHTKHGRCGWVSRWWFAA